MINTFWHFLTSNIKYNKIELGISYFISFAVILLFNYFKSDKNPDGDILFSVAFYAMLYAFYSNRRKINLKYLLSLPLSKAQLILTKVTSDFVYFIPSMALAFWGVMHTDLEFSAIPLIIILFQGVTFVAFVIFDGDIEQPRLENAKSSFINRLIYARKAIDFMFFSAFIIYVAMAVNMTPISMAIKQYFIIILLFLVLGMKFHRTLKLMKVEDLSYFIPRRDLFKIGWKVGIFAIPAVAFYFSGLQMPSKYGREKIYSMIQYGKTKGIEEEVNKITKIKHTKKGYTPITASILSGRVDVLNLLLEKGFEIDWEEEINTDEAQGLFPIHLAAMSGQKKMVEKLISLNKDIVDQHSIELKTSPLGMASKRCLPEIVDALVRQGAQLNYQDKNGDTPLILASKRKCYATISVLLDLGAKQEILNQDQKVAIEYIKKGNFKYLFTRRSSEKPRRSLANTVKENDKSIKKENSSKNIFDKTDLSIGPIKFRELQRPKLLRQEK